MITRDQYDEAVRQEKAAKEVMAQFNAQELAAFKERWAQFDRGEKPFTDDELIYSAYTRCEKCGAGVAYPRNCDPWHQWTCSDVLKGIGTDKGHSAFPFSFYEIKSEGQPSVNGATTRPK